MAQNKDAIHYFFHLFSHFLVFSFSRFNFEAFDVTRRKHSKSSEKVILGNTFGYIPLSLSLFLVAILFPSYWFLLSCDLAKSFTWAASIQLTSSSLSLSVPVSTVDTFYKWVYLFYLCFYRHLIVFLKITYSRLLSIYLRLLNRCSKQWIFKRQNEMDSFITNALSDPNHD